MLISSLRLMLSPAKKYWIRDVQNGEVFKIMLVKKRGISHTVYTLHVKPIRPTMHLIASGQNYYLDTFITSCLFTVTVNTEMRKLIDVLKRQRSITSQPEFVTILARD